MVGRLPSRHLAAQSYRLDDTTCNAEDFPNIPLMKHGYGLPLLKGEARGIGHVAVKVAANSHDEVALAKDGAADAHGCACLPAPPGSCLEPAPPRSALAAYAPPPP